jgi:hypothetical protein
VSPWDVAEYASLLLAAVVWARYVTVGAGGRDRGHLVVGLASLLPALIATRAWRLPGRLLFSGAVMPVATGVVCLVSPYGWSGGQVVASWTYAAAAFLAVVAFARTPARRQVAVVAIALVSLDQFAQSFIAWWGGRDPGKPMVGTFYWHNQFAAFLLPGAILGAALTTLSVGPARRLGWVVTPLCLSGVIFSTSRATDVLAILGLLAVGVCALRSPRPGRTLARLGCLCAVTAAAAAFFTSPVFFGHGSASPFSALDRRSGAEPLGGNSEVRADYMKAAVAEFGDRPLAGGGFSSFGPASQRHLPAGIALSPAAHSGLLQMYAEGGLVAGVPLSLLLIALAVAMRRRLKGLSGDPERATTVGIAFAAAVLLAHALVDFDWSYPSLLVMTGLLMGLLVSIPVRQPVPSGAPTGGSVRALAAVLTLAIVLAGAAVAHTWDEAQSALARSRGARTPAAAAEVLIAGRGALPDTRLDAQLLQVALSGGLERGLVLPESVVRQAVANTRQRAEVDETMATLRDGARFLLGERAQALADSRERARRAAAYNVNTVTGYAVLLVASGQTDQARSLLAREVVQRAAAGYRDGNHLVGLLDYLHTLGGARETDCAAVAIRHRYPELADIVNRISSTSNASTGCAELARGPVVT